MYNYNIEEILFDLKSDRKKKVILDTDAYNEIDDQFAIAYTVLSEKTLDVLGITAAPFLNGRCTSPEDGMLKSYEEIKKVIALTNSQKEIPVKRGARNFLVDEKTYSDSEAVDFIIEKALESDERIYVMGIGALTNIASALLKNPAIKDKVVIVWIGTHAPKTNLVEDFNMQQDFAASRVLFDSEAPVVLLPAQGCVSEVPIFRDELAKEMPNKNKLCDYLYEILLEYHADTPEESGIIIWDVACVAAVALNDAVAFEIGPSPIVTKDIKMVYDPKRHPILTAVEVDGKKLFKDLFEKLHSVK